MKLTQPVPDPSSSAPSAPESLSMRARRSELPDVAGPPRRSERTAGLALVPREPAAADSSRSIWEPADARPLAGISSSQVIHACNHATTSLSAAAEAHLIELITAPVDGVSGHELVAAAREARVCGFIDELSALDAYHLDRRIRCAAEGDPVVIALRRLIPARRQRIVEHLEQVRRARPRRTKPF